MLLDREGELCECGGGEASILCFPIDLALL